MLVALLAACGADTRDADVARPRAHRPREQRDEAAESCWGDDESWDTQSPAFLEQQPGVLPGAVAI